MNASAVRPPDDVDLISLVIQLWKGRWWIVGATVASVALAFIVAMRTPRVYQAQAIAAIASLEEAGTSPRLGQLGGLAALAGIGSDSNGAIEEALAVMRSREFSERFISEHNLAPTLFPEKWDNVKRSWKSGEEQRPTSADAYQRFDREVRAVTHDSKTNLVSISVVWPDPVVAAQLANALVDTLNREMRERAIARTDASLKFLQDELSRTSALDTREAINRLVESQIKQRMYANVTKDFALRVVDGALPPDLKNPVKPRVLVMLMLGAVFGSVAGCLLVLGRGILRDVRLRISHQS